MPWYLQVLAAMMAVLLLAFVIWFLGRGILLWYSLWRARSALRKEPGIPPDQLDSRFPRRAKLAHLWHEYVETLHLQRDKSTTTWRATIPSETYFNAENVVDAYVGAEFFRHLPGVFTGMGIIGTFAGLIKGLSGFRPTTDPAQTMSMIGPLIASVREAFFVSAAAITAAMIITLLEKFWIAVLYGSTAKVANGIDRLYDAGLDEEYLERLTKATEEGTSQAKLLKDALVKDLGDILQEVSRKQGEQIAISQRESSSAITGAVDRMTTSFSNMTSGTGDRTVQMLGDVMASFSAKLNELFGNQISGINEMSKQSATAMQSASEALRQLVDALGRAGKETTDQMASKMLEAIETMELRQTDINSRTEATLQKVADSMKEMIERMAASVEGARKEDRRRQDEAAKQGADVAATLGMQVDKAVAQMAGAAKAMSESVERLSGTTTTAIDKMNSGADKIAHSSEGLAAAAVGVEEVVRRASELGGELSTHSQELIDGGRALQAALEDYREQRLAIQQMMGEVRAMVDAARREASVTDNVLSRIEQSAQGLARTHDEFGKYLDGVNQVLAEASGGFREALLSTMKEANNGFHDELGSAVNLLKSAIEELGATIDSIPGPAGA